MAKQFFEQLADSCRAKDSLLCVGLDPRCNSADDARTQCMRLIEATAEVAAAYKPNSAYFEMHGPAGMQALQDVIAAVPHGTPVILDAKRGDIEATSAAYAAAAFSTFGAHAVTVNPYLGLDALEPFLGMPDKGVFVLCRTSNPGAAEFQDQHFGTAPLYEHVARSVAALQKSEQVGLVVGATDPPALAHVRQLCPAEWMLVPGVGTQGGDLRAVLAAGLRADGLGVLINASRSLAEAEHPRNAALHLRNQVNAFRQTLAAATKPNIDFSAPANSPFDSAQIAQLAADLIVAGCVRFGEFRLKSGELSPIYLDLRQLVSHPEVLQRVAAAYADLLRAIPCQRIAGIPYAALPIATALSLHSGKPLIYPRREAKAYGTRAEIEGEYHAGETIAVIDDLATSGESKFETLNKLEAVGLHVHDIMVLIDRGQGAAQILEAAGYKLHAVFKLPALLREWLRQRALTPEQYERVTTELYAEAR